MEYPIFKQIRDQQTAGIDKIKDSIVDFQPVIIMASYCSGNPKCTDAMPCPECISMSNIALINRTDIKVESVIVGYEFLRSLIDGEYNCRYCGDSGRHNMKSDLKEIIHAVGGTDEFDRLIDETVTEIDEANFDLYWEGKLKNL